MSERLCVLVLGIMGRDPCAGLAWEALHYIEGFRRLGHDVYYIEDDREWPYDPDQNAVTDDCTYAVNFIRRMMRWCGLPDQWAYRASFRDGQIYGMSPARFADLFARADALVNVTGSTILYGEHLGVPIRVYVQTDPGVAEIEVAKGSADTIAMLRAHTHFFSFAENLGAPDCGLPHGLFPYRLTRQPIVLDWFTPEAGPPHRGPQPACLRFTTVGNWQQTGCDVEWHGEIYTWSKHHEFLKFLGLPRRLGHPVELALSSVDDESRRLLTAHGWSVVEAFPMTRDILPYREYVFGSDGEFTVAKDQNVRLRTGWFSERSASYLTAGKPVITQDTGFGHSLPVGEGLFPFTTMEDIVAAFDAVTSDYTRHGHAARAIAEEYFRAETVLGRMLDGLGV